MGCLSSKEKQGCLQRQQLPAHLARDACDGVMLGGELVHGIKQHKAVSQGAVACGHTRGKPRQLTHARDACPSRKRVVRVGQLLVTGGGPGDTCVLNLLQAERDMTVSAAAAGVPASVPSSLQHK